MHLLLKLAPPQAIIHIGAGTGNGEMHQWRHWDIPHALIIDADRNRLNWTESLIAENPGWHALGAVLAETEGEIDYYQASNPEEDSLISPQCLNSLWPSLRTTAQDLRPSRRLDHLLAEDCSAALKQADPIWVFVDCLPALPILKGAGEHIDHWSALWLRVLLQDTAGIDECATLESTKAFLQPQGFRCIDVKESNHPAVGYALFMRDWRAVLQPRIGTLSQANTVLSEEILGLTTWRDILEEKISTVTQARNEQSQLAAERQARIEALTQERDNYARQETKRQAQIDALNQANTILTKERLTLTAQRDMLEQEVAALTQARNEQGQLAAERQAKIEALTQERDSYDAAKWQIQIETLTQARDEQALMVTQQKTELEQLQFQLEQSSIRITQLESELAGSNTRQHLLNEEIIKAEAQIELIKDVLLREPGL